MFLGSDSVFVPTKIRFHRFRFSPRLDSVNKRNAKRLLRTLKLVRRYVITLLHKGLYLKNRKFLSYYWMGKSSFIPFLHFKKLLSQYLISCYSTFDIYHRIDHSHATKAFIINN